MVMHITCSIAPCGAEAVVTFTKNPWDCKEISCWLSPNCGVNITIIPARAARHCDHSWKVLNSLTLRWAKTRACFCDHVHPFLFLFSSCSWMGCEGQPQVGSSESQLLPTLLPSNHIPSLISFPSCRRFTCCNCSQIPGCEAFLSKPWTESFYANRRKFPASVESFILDYHS